MKRRNLASMLWGGDRVSQVTAGEYRSDLRVLSKQLVTSARSRVGFIVPGQV